MLLYYFLLSMFKVKAAAPGSAVLFCTVALLLFLLPLFEADVPSDAVLLCAVTAQG